MFIELVMLSNHLFLCHSLLLLPSIIPRIRVLSNESTLHIRWPKYQSFSFSISSCDEYSGFIPLGLTGLISLLSKGLSRVFSSTAVSISASVLSLPYGPTLIAIHDYWENHNFDYMDLVDKLISVLFNMLSQVCLSFPSKKQVSLDFMTSVTIHSDFGVQGNKTCHCFHFFPFYLPGSAIILLF